MYFKNLERSGWKMLMDSSTNHRLPPLGGVELVEGGTGSVS